MGFVRDNIKKSSSKECVIPLIQLAFGGYGNYGTSELELPCSDKTLCTASHTAASGRFISASVYGIKADGSKTTLWTINYARGNTISLDVTDYESVRFEIISHCYKAQNETYSNWTDIVLS